MDEENKAQKILIYAGTTLDPGTIAEQLPDDEVIVKGPVAHGDFSTDLMEHEPAHVLIIEGYFHQSLSVWHKEIVWAMQMPGVKGVYGAASMGALRAADLANYGMYGCGKIFNWFFEGVTFREADVSCIYGRSPTIPMVNVAGALDKAVELGSVDEEMADRLYAKAKAIHWTERTAKRLGPLAQLIEIHNQKAIDALELLCTFRQLKQVPGVRTLGPEALSGLFTAQFERDRAVLVSGREVKLQDLDSYITLHDQDFEQHLSDADNRMLALMLADIYRIAISFDELDLEWKRFNVRCGLRSQAEHDQWLRDNHVNAKDLVRLLTDEARIRKLRRALMVRSGPRRRTQRLLDYLKLSRQYPYWANAAAAHEDQIKAAGGEAQLELGGETDVAILLSQHAKRAGITISTSLSEYVREAGFGTIRELMVSLCRDKLADGNGKLRPEPAPGA